MCQIITILYDKYSKNRYNVKVNCSIVPVKGILDHKK